MLYSDSNHYRNDCPSLFSYASYNGNCFYISSYLIVEYKVRRIMKFRKSLRRLPYYGLTADQVPVSNKALFLGRGFKWTQIHTQRLFFARLPENQFLREPGKIEKWLRENEIVNEGGLLAKLTGKNVWWNLTHHYPQLVVFQSYMA